MPPLRILVILSISLAAASYTWPADTDVLEDLYQNVGGFGVSGTFYDFITPCDKFLLANRADNSGRSTAAEWLRVAFHDAATYDVSTGEGGLDASISFETDRAENHGSSMNTSLAELNSFISSRVSAADVIALGAVAAVAACGGPKLPFRGGRKSALQAGPSGVPMPEQDLASHTATFAKAGFNVSDMITLVACGHTVGGVHSANFPEIVGTSAIASNNTDGVVPFDSTFHVFDNSVATSFLDGTTTNPLVVGPNETFHSDDRIFQADGNATISQLASSSDAYNSMCSSLLSRMFDSVPSGTNLVDVTPIPVKPTAITLTVDASGTVTFKGYIRLLDVQANDKRTVSVHYLSRNGEQCDSCTISTTTNANQTGTSFSGGRIEFYSFNTTFPSTTGISAFWVEYSENDGSASVTADNEGNKFPLSDSLLHLPAESCNIQPASGGVTGLNVTSLVLDSSSLDGVTFALTQRQKQLGSMIDAMNTTQFTAEKSKAYGSSGYTRYHATLNNVWTSGDLIAYDVLGTDSKDSSTKVVVPFINKLDVFPGCTSLDLSGTDSGASSQASSTGNGSGASATAQSVVALLLGLAVNLGFSNWLP